MESEDDYHSRGTRRLETIAEDSREAESRRESRISFLLRKEIPAQDNVKKGTFGFDDFQSLTENNSMLNSQNSVFYLDRQSERRINPSPGQIKSTEFFPTQTK